jgi:EAL domain-containing protein (putative c-di-GMP-specific phosphodiesterase class I)
MEQLQKTGGRPIFGRRRVVHCACIADQQHDFRSLIAEALQDLGFVTCECAQVGALVPVLDAYLPELIVVGLSGGEIEAAEILNTLASKRFSGMVLLLGSQDDLSIPNTLAVLGDKLGLAILPMLPTSFGSDNLRDSVAALPPSVTANPQVDLTEALRAGWLELWYQPKTDARTLALRSAEALVRIRHPYWGVVNPGSFLPDSSDPDFQALSEFVIQQAIADWTWFRTQHKPVDLSINLPMSFLRKRASCEHLCRQVANNSSFPGLIVEVDGNDILPDLLLACDLAKRLRFQRIAISIDDVGKEWLAFTGLDDFPFVKIKVDREFVSGCADDASKRQVCRQIIKLAQGYGARAVAEGVETRADFLVARELGFDLIQGFLFGKPMTAWKFARTMLRH